MKSNNTPVQSSNNLSDALVAEGGSPKGAPDSSAKGSNEPTPKTVLEALDAMGLDVLKAVPSFTGQALAHAFENTPSAKSNSNICSTVFHILLPELSNEQLMEIFLHFAKLAPKFTSRDRAKYKEIMNTSSMMLMAHMFKTGQCNITGPKSSPDTNSKMYSRQKLLESLIKPLVTGGSTKLSADSPIDQQLTFKKSLILSLAVRTPWARLLRSTLKYDSAKPDKLFETLKSMNERTLSNIDFNANGHADASLSMYLALYESLSHKFRNELALQDTKIQNQGPRLLWFILHRITERDGIIVKNFMSNLTQLETTLRDSNWDIVKHSSKLHDQLREYDNAGGQIANVETLITGIYLKIPHENFKSALREKRDLIAVDGKTHADPAKYNVLELLRSVPDIVQDLKSHNDWDLGPRKEKKQQKTKVPKEPSAKSDLASFEAKMDAKLADLKSVFKASINTNDNNNNNSNSNRNGLGFRRSDDQWTNSESFGSAQEFDDFVEGKKRKDHGDTVSANGTTWRWCTNCSRMGNHSTSYCKHTGPAPKKAKFGNSIPTLKKSCKSNIAISPHSESQQSDQSQTFIAAEQLDDQSMDGHSDDSSINEDENALFGVLGDLNVA